ncbi:MAG: ornithine cyclodeaminase family protein [Acidaminobacteraceae bacterium]
MRYLNEKAISSSITYDDMVIAVEEALIHYKNGDYNMPERFHYTHEDKTLLYMPCFSNGILGTKILTVFPGNIKKNHPVIDGLMLLNDYETGAPKAMIDGKLLTALRTGAVGAIGTKYISNVDSKTLGLIGAGAQGIYQIIFACHLRPITDVYITTRSQSKLEDYIKKLKIILPNINFHASKSTRELVEKSDIIITATSSMTPVLPEEKSLYIGKTFIAIGSFKPDMRELPNALMEVASEIYVDIDYAKEESGDLKIPLEDGLIKEEKIKSIAVLVDENRILDNKDKTIVYKSVGMALFDVIVATKILECAENKGLGQLLEE